MLVDNGRISKGQLVYLMVGFLYGSAVIVGVGSHAGPAGWLAVLIGVAEACVFIFIFGTLSSRFPGKSFIEIADEVYGCYLGKVVSLLYLWFLFHIGSLIIRTYGDFLSFTLLPGTPIIILMGLLLVVSGSAVRNGIEVLARCSQFIVPVAIIAALVTFALLLKEFNMQNLVPLLGDKSLKEVLWAGHQVAVFPGGEAVAFMMVTPFIRNKRGTTATMIAALALTGLFGAATAVRNAAVLGETLQAHVYPTYSAIRLVNVGNLLTRLEIFEVINLITMGFIQLSVVYFGVVLGISQMAKLKSPRSIVYPVGILMILLAVLNFANVAEHFEFSLDAWPYYAVPFELGLPLLTLVIAMVRGLPKQQSK